MSHQLTFADSEFSTKRRQTRKEIFLSRMEQILPWQMLWSSFFGHADQMVGLCTGGQLGGRAGQRFVLCG